ncbi:MAG: inorganic phosphate transporter [Actinobacteria bacterium]|nr:inorganic phosphate transporter [Actinomycetota bacterium]
MFAVSFEATVIILVALSFDFVNGFHDAANSIATVVSTRVLAPRFAVAWAAFWNFIAFLVFGTAVASTIGKGTIDISQITSREAGLNLILAALIGAIAWDLLTWYYGLPSSSSHALVGGLAGAAVSFNGVGMLEGAGITKTALFIVISPVVGFVISVLLMNLMLLVGQKITLSRRGTLAGTNWLFRKLQLLSAAAYSLGHGANDAQKTMGIIAAVILIDRGASIKDFEITLPIVLAAHSAIALGTLSGGWRIVHTLGSKITKLQPIGGFSAETAAAATLFTTASLGIPVSTTHTITGAIIGVGSTNRFSAVRWGLTGRVLYAWIVTIPGAAAIAAFSYVVLQVAPASMVGVIGLGAAFSWGVFFLIRKRRATQETVFAPPA